MPVHTTAVDLRSDTVTHPTAAMRATMAAAEVGDDVYGEDPTTNYLQERVARLLDKEMGLFFPSGTMCNQVAIAAHCQPGQEVICDRDCHVFNYESGAAARLSGVQLHTLPGPYGLISAEQVDASIRPVDTHNPQTGLILLENTHNRGGGVVHPLQDLEQIGMVARRHGVPMHLDGARLLNASVASGTPPDQIARPFDSVYFCLSKGLGCPIGSVLAGSSSFIARATYLRKAFGGGMRQSGILAAAGLYALDHHVDRLAEDHHRARRLASTLAALPVFAIDLEAVQTNIVLMDILPDHLSAPVVAAELATHGVLVSIFGPRRLRLVTHLDIDDSAVERAITAFKTLYG